VKGAPLPFPSSRAKPRDLFSPRYYDVIAVSHYRELEASSSTEHAFFCNDGWFIYADREVATR
jgi:hypothetical protein